MKTLLPYSLPFLMIFIALLASTCGTDIEQVQEQVQVKEKTDVVYMGIITDATFHNKAYGTVSKMTVHTDTGNIIVLKQVYRVKIGDSLFVHSEDVRAGYELYKPWEK